MRTTSSDQLGNMVVMIYSVCLGSVWGMVELTNNVLALIVLDMVC